MLVEPETKNTAVSISASVASLTQSDIDNITQKDIIHRIFPNRDKSDRHR